VLERFADAGDARQFVSVLMDWNGVSLSAQDKRVGSQRGRHIRMLQPAVSRRLSVMV